MGSINIPNAAKVKNDVLRKTVQRGNPVALKLWKPTDNSIGGRMESATATDGWYYKQHKHAEVDEVTEMIKIVESATITQDVIDKATGCDIIYADSTFERFSIGPKSFKHPFLNEWTLTIRPMRNDTSPLWTP